MKYVTTEYKTNEIKAKRKFIRQYVMNNEKIIDITSYNKTTYQVYTITINHIIWKYVFNFSDENVIVGVDLMVEKGD